MTGKLRKFEASLRTYIGFSICIWIIPIATSTTGLGLGIYRPVTAGWCWISRERLWLRYALSHGERIAIILVTIAIYTRLWLYMRRHHKNMTFLTPRRTPIVAANSTDQAERGLRTEWPKDSSRHSNNSNGTGTAMISPNIPSMDAAAGIRKTEVFSVRSMDARGTPPLAVSWFPLSILQSNTFIASS